MFSSLTIKDISVSGTGLAAPVSKSNICIEFTDAAGAREKIDRHGPAALAMWTDLHRVSAEGEIARFGYLFGFIRSHQLRRADE